MIILMVKLMYIGAGLFVVSNDATTIIWIPMTMITICHTDHPLLRLLDLVALPPVPSLQLKVGHPGGRWLLSTEKVEDENLAGSFLLSGSTFSWLSTVPTSTLSVVMITCWKARSLLPLASGWLSSLLSWSWSSHFIWLRRSFDRRVSWTDPFARCAVAPSLGSTLWLWWWS